MPYLVSLEGTQCLEIETLIPHIERSDPVTALPSLRTGTGQVCRAHGHGKGVYSYNVLRSN